MRQLNKTKLEKLLAKLDKGKAVSLRDIKSNLGDSGVAEYEQAWAAELERRKFFDVKPDQIKQYDELIKQADFANNKYQPDTKHPKPTEHFQKCIDLHKSMVSADSALAKWFDRTANEVTADFLGVARLVTSRSPLNRTGGSPVTKETIKRDLLTAAINQIKAEQKAFSESVDGKKLKLMLADLKAKSRL